MRNQLIVGLALVFACSGAAVAKDLSDWDSESDGYISMDEFYGGVSDLGVYSDWDLDGDGFVDEDEFNEIGLDADYDYWDVDDNGYLDSGEFYDGYYDHYDANEDGHWNNGEWDDADEDGFFDV